MLPFEHIENKVRKNSIAMATAKMKKLLLRTLAKEKNKQ